MSISLFQGLYQGVNEGGTFIKAVDCENTTLLQPKSYVLIL